MLAQADLFLLIIKTALKPPKDRRDSQIKAVFSGNSAAVLFKNDAALIFANFLRIFASFSAFSGSSSRVRRNCTYAGGSSAMAADDSSPVITRRR
jgi:hypothetical protein